MLDAISQQAGASDCDAHQIHRLDVASNPANMRGVRSYNLGQANVHADGDRACTLQSYAFGKLNAWLAKRFLKAHFVPLRLQNIEQQVPGAASFLQYVVDVRNMQK